MLADTCLILSLWRGSVLCFNRVVDLDELRALLARHARPDMSTTIEGVLISKVEQQTAPTTSMSGTVLALIAQGAKQMALGDRVYEYRAGQYLVASVDLPVTGRFTAGKRRRAGSGVRAGAAPGHGRGAAAAGGARATSRPWPGRRRRGCRSATLPTSSATR